MVSCVLPLEFVGARVGKLYEASFFGPNYGSNTFFIFL